MLTLMIAAAAAAVQPAAPAPKDAAQPQHAQHEHGMPARTKDMAKKHEGHDAR